jgi:hypothetical protein
MNLRKVKEYGVKWFSIFFICNTLFIAIYVAASFIPSETVIQQLNSARETGVLKTPEYSIGRSTTGLGMDFGTECVALGIGLRSNPKHEQVNQLWSRFDESYLAGEVVKKNWDPCAGLVEIISPGDELEEAKNLSSYARNWWGMSIVIQVGVSLFGLATFKTYLYIIMTILGFVLYQKFSKIMNNHTIGLFLFGPFVLTADFQDLYNVAPYSLFTIQMFLFGIIIIGVLNNESNQKLRIFQYSIIFGCFYNFMFWLNFHLILTLIPSLIYLVSLKKYSHKKIMSNVNVFLVGFISSFAFTTLLKWIIGLIIYGGGVGDQVIKALALRLSPGKGGLNGPLLEYSSSVDFLPIPLRAIVLNVMVYASKIIDPRYTNLWTIGLLVSVTVFCLIYALQMINFSFTSAYRNILPAFPIILIPFVYFAITSNHSFNHAAITYRALPLTLGFVMSISYLSHLRKEIFLNETLK